MKYEWRKVDKELYLPKSKPIIFTVPKLKYITIKGEGNPGSIGFQKSIEAMYAMAYGIKMTLKKQPEIKGYNDFTVFPLEGLWDLNQEGRNKYKEGIDIQELKDHFVYTLMIRQPSFVSKSFFDSIKDIVSHKKQQLDIRKVVFEEIDEGLSCQMMHLGSYDNEKVSFDIMEGYCIENGYQRISKTHKEIYISDARKVTPNKLKTTLRFKVAINTN